MAYFWQNPSGVLKEKPQQLKDMTPAEYDKHYPPPKRSRRKQAMEESRQARARGEPTPYDQAARSVTGGFMRLGRNPSDLTVANLILQQLGGAGRLKAMIGAGNFVGDANSLTFKFKAKARNGANTLQVTLDPSDTYTMKFFSIRGTKVRVVRELDDVYAEDLQRLFTEETGLYLSL